MTLARSLSVSPPGNIAAQFPGARCEALVGGRTNRLWQVTRRGAPPLVVKLHDPARTGPLFPNLPQDEARALRELEGTRLAPRLVSETPWLTYEFTPGQTPCRDVGAAARALARLHARPGPKGFRVLPGGHAAVLALGNEMARGSSRLAALRPAGRVPPAVVTAFLHGDPVPANLVETPRGVVLIDWQCPAVGDPCEDVAIFLSPAMQSLYGGAPLGASEVAAFFDAYGDAVVAARYRALAPAYHWRMAAYCLWMAERGHRDYGEAAELEIAALQR